ncbi:Cadherin-related tumor suppressor [Hypsibius exemplaris]|uniref:Cadherin-related tumor suppressor n=1 Tax=Hypsibius exemplaris TaxID=2072580 RepID=A0A1W0X242_HYPEX|nr:Cadherin-related tumor suppressor [Hypsibius exemplaris]
MPDLPVFLPVLFLLVFTSLTSGLQFHVAEELPAGTKVGQIPGRPASRTALTNHQDVFRLDPVSGKIFTLKPIDRDTLKRDSFELFIANQDQSGFPTTVNVVVTDINDNAPAFPERTVGVVFLETDTVGQQVLLDAATDADSGENGRIGKYDIVSGNEEGLWRLVVRDNFLHLENLKVVDREVREAFLLNISATDNGVPAQRGFLVLNITVGDINDQSPIFDPSEYVVALGENAPPGSMVLKVHATDNDALNSANSRIVYTLADASQFTVDAESGVIRTSQKKTQCPRSKCPNGGDCPRTCVLTVEGRDCGAAPLTGRAYVYITLMDENDHAPELTFRHYPSSAEHATVAEDAMNGTVVAVISVRDGDEGANGKVTVSVTGGNREGLFRVEAASFASSGMPYSRSIPQMAYLKVNGQFNRARMAAYNLTITAVDAGYPSLNTSKCLTVIVNQINDHSPVFPRANYHATVNENSPVGSYVSGEVTATDADGPHGINGRILYSIVAGNARGWFNINGDTGMVTTGQALDREVEEVVRLNISARDAAPSPRIAYAMLTVIIADWNDHYPRFTHCPAGKVTLPGGTPVGTVVHNFAAADEDAGENGAVSYALFELRIPKAHTASDIGTPNDGIIADNGISPFLAAITVRIVSASAGPVFSALYWTIPTPDKLPAGHKIAQVKAEAAFDDEAGLIRYAIAHSSRNEISLDGRSGLLSTGDRELLLAPGELVKVQITATDSRGRAAERPTTVMLFPAHATENGTFGFTNAEGFHFTVRENSLSNFVGEMRLLDHESWPDVEYFITAGDALGQFTVDAATGHLRSAYPLDREAASSYHLHVTAWRSPFFARTSVQVRVEDENDNAPIIGNLRGDVYEIPRSWPVGLPLLSVRAEDADAGVNGQTTFSLVEEDGGADKQAPRLAVNRTTGSIYLVHPLSSSDTETVKSVVVVVQATDGGNLSSKGERIRFRFGPPKNCRIHFLNSMYRLSLPEDQAVNSRILNLTMQTCNQPIDFAFSHGNEAGHFGVFPDGQVYLNGSLDRAITAYYALHVTASSSDSFHSTTTSAVVMIHITGDTNHHAPAFSRSEYAFTVGENAAIGTFVGRPEAADFDDGLNGDLRYGLSECEGLFTVEPETGVVRTGVVFDREKSGLGVYTVTVTATDRADLQRNRNGQANLARNSTATIRIAILDENDNAPQFTQSS